MASENIVMLIGNLGRKPELQYTQSGVPVCTLSVATERRWLDRPSGEWKGETEWHRVKVWRDRAEKAAQWDKGQQVRVIGYLKTEKWEKDGQTHYSTDIIADKVFLTGSRNEGKPAGVGDSGHYEPPAGWTATEKTDELEDLPF